MDDSEQMVSALKDAVACAVTMRGPHTIEERAALVDQTTAAILAAMRKGGVPQWQTIDSAPKDGRYVDLWSIERDHGFGFRTVNAFWKDGGWHQRHWGKLTCSTVTHWMELPTGPGTAAPQPPAADTSLEYAQIFEEGRLRGRAEHIAETTMVNFAARMYGIEPLDRDGIIEACVSAIAELRNGKDADSTACYFLNNAIDAIRAMKVQK